MIESNQVLGAVKQALRARGVTYRQLGKLVKMSESGVKKLFATGDCSLGRLLEICEAVGVSLEDVAREAPRRDPVSFSATQEAFFLANPQCFYFLWDLMTHNFDAAAVA